jgi:hypothetical protein
MHFGDQRLHRHARPCAGHPRLAAPASGSESAPIAPITYAQPTWTSTLIQSIVGNIQANLIGTHAVRPPSARTLDTKPRGGRS